MYNRFVTRSRSPPTGSNETKKSFARSPSVEIVTPEPVADAVVYLKNLKNDAIRTTIAGSDGTYRFSGLDPNVDYEVHAEHKENASAARKVSSFDTRREMVIHLKINKKKE